MPVRQSCGRHEHILTEYSVSVMSGSVLACGVAPGDSISRTILYARPIQPRGIEQPKLKLAVTWRWLKFLPAVIASGYGAH